MKFKDIVTTLYPNKSRLYGLNCTNLKSNHTSTFLSDIADRLQKCCQILALTTEKVVISEAKNTTN